MNEDCGRVDLHLARDYWHLIGHRAEVGRDRDFIHVDWPLGEIVAWNDGGQISAFDNICPHRGAKIFTQPHGNAPFVCPYHGWAYRQGRLLVANSENFLEQDRSRAALNKYQIAWCGDFLFVGFTPVETLRSQLGDLANILESISADVVERYDLNSAVWDCDWRVAVENALEPDHVPFVHPKTLGALSLGPLENSYSGKNSILKAGISNARLRRQLDSFARFYELQYQYPGYLSLFLFPFSFVTSTYAYSYSVQNFFPTTDFKSMSFTSKMFITRTRSEEDRRKLESYFSSVKDVNRKVFDEDLRVCSRISRNYSMDGRNRIFSRSEEKARHFYETLQQMKRKYSEGSTRSSGAGDVPQLRASTA